jgi:hypothetical protein
MVAKFVLELVYNYSLYVIAPVGGIERTKLQIGARPDKRRNARAG